ncbi:phage protease [Paracoccus sp. SSJ]|uniref:phage protease n=1 Tax=Paracoccus sp. SSJ TaxID=3050636 RepID=UPI00254DFBCC|nr:phage protease [Paracoccus sp. SSJ]MDK8873929.1 phage protease [Paracoccus sp. SSJ]
MVEVTDLPADVRRAYELREIEATGLPAGDYDDAAHERFAEATPAMQAIALRKAEIARFLVKAGAGATFGLSASLVQAVRQEFGPEGTDRMTLRRILRTVEGVDPINFAPALMPDFSRGGRPQDKVSAEAWSFFMTTIRDAGPQFPFKQAWRDVRDVARKRGWQWPAYRTVLRRWNDLPEALGLAPDASEADILDLLQRLRDMLGRVTGAKGAVAQLAELAVIARDLGQENRIPRYAEGEPDPARFVPAETLQAVLTERNEAQAVLREQNAKARVDDAFARGYLSPAMRDWAMALCMSDPPSFDLFIEKAVPPYAHLFKPATTSAMPPGFASDGGAAIRSAEEIAICEQLGLKPGSLLD